ncbi:MAG: hypothetical protein ACTSQK_11525, partial [Candidatus Heimdallarchaeota archaeon]
YDPLISELENWFRYTPGFCAFLHRNFTNPETFYKNPVDSNYNLTPEIIGLFSDNHGAEEIGDYNATGQCIVERISGNDINGIFEYRVFGYSDWGSSNTTIYAKYEIVTNNAIGSDDELTIEYYDSLLDAEAGFTANNISYTRFVPNWDLYEAPEPEPETPTSTAGSGFSFLFGQTILIVSFAVLIIIQKKKTK